MFQSMYIREFDSRGDTQDLIVCGAIYSEISLATSIPWGDYQRDNSRSCDMYDQYVSVGLGLSLAIRSALLTHRAEVDLLA